jgi:hypothetical protein
MDRTSLDTLWARQLGWTGGVTAAGLLAAVSGGATAFPELSVLPVGIGISCAFPRRAHVAVGVASVGVLTALLLGLLTPETSTLSGLLSVGAGPGAPELQAIQAIGAALVMGALLPFVDEGPRDGGRMLNGALALATCSSLAAWASHSVVFAGWRPMASAAVAGLVAGAISSAALLVLAIRHRTVDRIPDREIIATTLDGQRRGAALMAWQIDASLDDLCPDADTRDGLGEVAAWVYRLQWTRQQLDLEGGRLGGGTLEARIMDLSSRAAESEDPFSRDRLLASVRHLQRIQSHRCALHSERTRAGALAEFAMAFLEEARTELTLARVHPSGLGPERLPEVLHRLRSYSTDRALARNTTREVSVLGGH